MTDSAWLFLAALVSLAGAVYETTVPVNALTTRAVWMTLGLALGTYMAQPA